MKKKIISFTCFWLIVLILFGMVSEILLPTWSDKAGIPLVRTKDFYAQEENTMDAMIFGSSYSYYDVSPLPIWNNYGITTYCFGNPSQRVWTTYYYMEEAFKYQSPKVVFYEMGTSYITEAREDGQNRQSLDPLPLSVTKIKAILEITSRTNETIPSYILPGLRYHSRWKELTEEDFSKDEEVSYYGRGALMRFGAKPARTKDIKKWMTDTGEDMVFPEENEKYIDMMLELCEKNNAELIFVRFPEVYWTKNHHDMIADMAEKKGVKYLDFNTFSKEYGLNWKQDTTDRGSHLNVKGSEKVSNYLGQWLKDNYGFEDKRNNPQFADWEENAKRFQKVYEKNEIANIVKINNYLTKIQDECYTAIVTVRNDTTKCLSDETKEILRRVGVKENVFTDIEGSYIGILDGGELVYQKSGYEFLEYIGIIGDIKIEAKSGGRLYGDQAKTYIDDIQYAANDDGINIVVYDKELKRVVDSVAFNTTIQSNKISRKMQNNALDEF